MPWDLVTVSASWFIKYEQLPHISTTTHLFSQEKLDFLENPELNETFLHQGTDTEHVERPGLEVSMWDSLIFSGLKGS